jgi:hypothetical protein
MNILNKSLLFVTVSMLFVFFNSACSSKPKNTDNTKAAATSENKTAVSQPETSSTTTAQDKSTSKNEKSKSSSGTSASGVNVAGTFTCSSGSDSRSLEIKDLESGCEVIYTKQNEPKTIAQAKNDKSFCSQTVDKVKGNLENAGFKCQ